MLSCAILSASLLEKNFLSTGVPLEATLCQPIPADGRLRQCSHFLRALMHVEGETIVVPAT